MWTLQGDHLFLEESGSNHYLERYDPCFLEETGPHQVVKEEVVEPTIVEISDNNVNDVGNFLHAYKQ